MVTRLEAGDKSRGRKREADGGWVSDEAVRHGAVMEEPLTPLSASTVWDTLK